MATSHTFTGERAIDKYLELIAAHPALTKRNDTHFAGRSLPLLIDKTALLQHLNTTGEDVGLLRQTPYFIDVADLVEAPDGSRFVYNRRLNANPGEEIAGVTCVARTKNQEILLLRHDRHATGKCHFELPRGFKEPGETPEKAAIRELEEETGYKASSAHVLHSIYTDNGLTAAKVSFVLLEDLAEPTEINKKELAESIHGVHLTPYNTLLAMISTGEIDEAFTIGAVGLIHAYASKTTNQEKQEQKLAS